MRMYNYRPTCVCVVVYVPECVLVIGCLCVCAQSRYFKKNHYPSCERLKIATCNVRELRKVEHEHDP